MDFLQELYDDCDKLRQTVIQLATESEDNDSSLGELYMHIYKKKKNQQDPLINLLLWEKCVRNANVTF